jgi:hypothetical protein
MKCHLSWSLVSSEDLDPSWLSENRITSYWAMSKSTKKWKSERWHLLSLNLNSARVKYCWSYLLRRSPDQAMVGLAWWGVISRIITWYLNRKPTISKIPWWIVLSLCLFYLMLLTVPGFKTNHSCLIRWWW